MKNWVFTTILLFGAVSLIAFIIINDGHSVQQSILDTERSHVSALENEISQKEGRIEANYRQIAELSTDTEAVADEAMIKITELIELMEANQSEPIGERMDILNTEGSDYALERALDPAKIERAVIPTDYDLVINTARAKNMSVMLFDTSDNQLRHIEFKYDALAKKVSEINTMNVRS